MSKVGLVEVEFIYNEYAPPTITSISPNTGPTAGGTTITITGTKFDTDFPTSRTVKIDGNLCTNFQNVTDTSFDCDTPPGSAGAKDVEVEIFYNSGTPGTAVTETDGYTYVAPTLPTFAICVTLLEEKNTKLESEITTSVVGSVITGIVEEKGTELATSEIIVSIEDEIVPLLEDC